MSAARRLSRCLAGLLALAGAACAAATPAAPDLRPALRQYLDELAGYAPVALAHTTDALAPARPPARRRPALPAPFAAGRFKVEFARDGSRRALLVQTEEQVGHFSTIRPGRDAIGGYVQLFGDASAQLAQGPLLNQAELDYLIRGVYARFCRPLEPAAALVLDQLKDRLLAIRFSGGQGLRARHDTLLGQLDSGALCRPPSPLRPTA